KPLTDYTINLKDKVTGEIITLTPDNPQENNATIKTRAVTMTQDIENGFAYITVEFLTKTPSFASTGTSPQDFYYDISVEDSKGDTDTASKIFSVNPDLPPAPAISMDPAFLRNEGTNIASIITEDVTIAADGDEVERTWYLGHGLSPGTFTDVSTLSGYQKLSFGTDKIVGFDKPGVGKFAVKLYVKEKWTEPTLEEYVTDADRLTGQTTTGSDVLNVAPTVSLEMLRGIEQEVLLLAGNDAEYQALNSKKTELKQALLANKIDAQIITKRLIGNTPPSVTEVQQQQVITYPYPARALPSGLATGVNEEIILATDSERTYFLTYTWINGDPTVPKTIHAIDTYKGEVWTYTTDRNEEFSFGHDDTGTYLYLVYGGSNQTVLLDKRTGAAAGTINMALPGNVWLSDNLMFMTEGTNLYAVNLNTLTKTLAAKNVSAVSRVGGDLQFIEIGNSALIRCTLDMETLSVEKNIIIDTTSAGDYQAVCIDSKGKAVFFKHPGGEDSFRGIIAYDSNNTLVKQVAVPAGWDRLNGVYYSSDEKGECNHVLVYEEDTPGVNTHCFRFVDLKTGALAYHTKRTDAYNGLPYAGSFESNGVSHFMFSGWYMYPGGTYYYGNNYTFTFDGSSAGASVNVPGTNGSLYENIKVSDRTFAAFNGDNKPGTGTFALKIMAFPRTLAQETEEIISRFTDKLTFIGNVDTVAEQIKTAAEAPKPVIKVTANNNGNLTLNNLSLMPGKKYYYEYDIKPLKEETKDKLTGISASTGTAASNQAFINDTLYVTNSYEEDFNSGKISSFFTVNDAGKFYNGKYGAYRDDYPDNYMKLSFVVPSGKQAVVSLDYSLMFDNRREVNYPYEGTHVFIDGMRVKEDIVYGNNNGSYSFIEDKSILFYKLLSPGTHTIECRVSAHSSYWEHVLIDNLRVDLLSAAPKAVDAALNTQPGDSEGWLTLNGSFDVPNKVISYGAQISSTYWGATPSEVTATYYYKKKGTYHVRSMNYYQTVPAGYIQKGRVHLGSGYFLRYGYTDFNIVGTPEFRIDYEDCSYIDTWRTLQPKTAGTYTHSLYNGHPEDTQSWMDVFDLVTYFDNEVTRTGNMAFNNTNTKYFFPKVTSTQSTDLNMFIPKGEYLIKNLRLYYMENGQ
ncbi:MAG: hypothetical protein PHY15_10435, partial [Eubacteriales bacterium]|nr:hypothetical protein [Eubacteriales bacterium]